MAFDNPRLKPVLSKISRTDVLPISLTHEAPRACGAPLLRTGS